jgi:hypothetical protein
MTLNIDLKVPKFAKAGEKQILIPEESVLIQIYSTVYELGTIVVTVKNEYCTKQFKTTGGSFIDITEFCKKSGLVEIEVDKIIEFESVKKWRVEPILLREIESEFCLIPEIEAIKDELGTVKKALSEVAGLIKQNEIV